MEMKTIVLALVAHDNMKRDLAEWVDWNSRKLSRHHLVCTGTTCKRVEKTLRDHKEEHEAEDEPKPGLRITQLKSGRLGGDQQLGSLIADGKVYSGRGISTDIVESSIRAYINALNKIAYEEQN